MSYKRWFPKGRVALQPQQGFQDGVPNRQLAEPAEMVVDSWGDFYLISGAGVCVATLLWYIFGWIRAALPHVATTIRAMPATIRDTSARMFVGLSSTPIWNSAPAWVLVALISFTTLTIGILNFGKERGMSWRNFGIVLGWTSVATLLWSILGWLLAGLPVGDLSARVLVAVKSRALGLPSVAAIWDSTSAWALVGIMLLGIFSTRSLWPTRSSPSNIDTTLTRIQRRELAIGAKVGEGQYAVVRQATWTRNCMGKQRKMEVAVKTSSRIADSSFNILPAELVRELEVISNLPHRNILGLHGVCESGQTWIVYELMTTDLAKLLQEAKDKGRRPLLPPHTLLRVLRDISAGLAHLHENGVLHRDVKPANVLLRDEDEQKRGDFDQVKLCDFGSSKNLVQTMKQMTMAGTLDYMAPEVRNNEAYGKSADVWSFGVLLFECVTGKVPRKKEELKDCRPELVELFLECQATNPHKRPSMERVHQKLRKLIMDDLEKLQNLEKVEKELKRAQAQDRDTYERVWVQDLANKAGSKDLLAFAKQLALSQPLSIEQPLEGKNNLVELEKLADWVCDRFHAELSTIVTTSGGKYTRAPRKAKEQSKAKVDREYGGDFKKLLDLERATGLFEDPKNMLNCLQRVRDGSSSSSSRPLFVLLRCKDRLNYPDASGYRDILLNVRDERTGFVMELQLNFPKIAHIKEKSHIIYELTRVMQKSFKQLKVFA